MTFTDKMNGDKLISVVIPLYNKESSIRRTLESVFSQTYQHFEIIIVDDGSTDNSTGIIESYNDSRIYLIRQKNAGVSSARNNGIYYSKGDYIAFLDADDEWTPHYLESLMELVGKYPECQVFATNYSFQTNKGNRQSTILNRITFQEESGILNNYFEVASCGHPPVWSSAVMIRKSAIVAVGGFPLSVGSGEDLLTWAKLACQNKIAYTKKVGAIYNLGEGYDFANQPPRRQDAGDPVGKELKQLWQQFHTPDLKRYIAHWHKMRASVAIRYFERRETLAEACKSFICKPNTKILPFFIMPFLPKRIIKALFLLHQ